MFNAVVGGILVLFFIGLPIGIIGLFIDSILERRPASSLRTITRLPEAPAASDANKGRRDRRAVIYEAYGRHSSSAPASDERAKLPESAETEAR